MDDQTSKNNSPKENVFLIINKQITSLAKSVTRLGRQLDNDIVFQEVSVSRKHAEIRYEGGQYILCDQQSTSGTFVNGLRIERCVLNSGDLISLAKVQFMFVNNNPKIADHSVIKTRTFSPPPDKPGEKTMENKRVILIIDDDDVLRLGLTATLRRKNYSVVAVSNGQDGLERIKTLKPDMILSDVMMPPPNGFELRKLISQEPDLASIPFIFLTARSGVEDRVSGIDEGADDYITKPFDPKELVARIEAVFRRIELEQAHGREEMKSIANHEMEQFKHEILQNFHHELRTPLTNILLPLDTILNHKFDDPEDLTRFIRMARSNADRLESLITDFILLTNIDQGDLNTVRQPIDVETQLLAPIRRRMERYSAKNLQFVTNISLEGKLAAPRKEFTHSVIHLLDNAFKFSPEGGRVELSVSTNASGDTTILVKDEGPGIPIDLREKVFERFFQTSQGKTREYEGLGVGLTLARAVAEKMGGSLRILEATKGCCVELVLPGNAPGELSYG